MLTLSIASFKKFFEKLRGTPSKKKEEKPTDAKATATEPAKATETKPAGAAPAAAPTTTTTEGDLKPAEADAAADATKAAEGKKKKGTMGGLCRKIAAHFRVGTTDAPKPAEPAAADVPATTTEPAAAAPTEAAEAPKA